MIPGIVTLDRGPDQSPGVRPIFPSHLGLRETRMGGPSWVQYRSGVTGGPPHPGVDILPDLSPRAKPYYMVKCSQGLHGESMGSISKEAINLSVNLLPGLFLMFGCLYM